MLLFRKTLTATFVITILAISISAQVTCQQSSMKQEESEAKKKPVSSISSLSRINSQSAFDMLARVYNPNTSYALPHVMFAIDRQNDNAIYYINSQKFRFHKDFLRAMHLVIQGGDAFETVYIDENRRFIVGTIAWQTPVEKFTLEFWDGDLIPKDLLKLTYDKINSTFFEPVAFKPNSIRQDDISKDLGIKRITTSEISSSQEYQPLNMAKGVGRVHIIEDLDDPTVQIDSNEILVLNEMPLTLPPVSGLIITKPTTPLSHVNLLAKGWGIPNAYIKNADKLYKEFDGLWIELETTQTEPKVKLAGKDELEWFRQMRESRNQVVKAPPLNLEISDLATLNEMPRTSVDVYGAKAANLGEVTRAKIPGVLISRGFGVPFRYFDEFMKQHKFNFKVEDFQYDDDFVHNPVSRKKKLEAFRKEMEAAEVDPKVKKLIVDKWKKYLNGKGVFVRSSSNAEDMPGFSGAGLYETVPNVKNEEALIEAVKKVWASLYNIEAWDARDRNFIDHNGTKMGVLIQTGVDVDNSGVLVTKDPFNDENKGAVYISAKRGLGIKVVDGKKIAEQVLYSKNSDAVQVLTRSAEDTELIFDSKGGVKEVAIEGSREVLTDSVVRRLVKAGNSIKKLFGGEKDQDIEWGFKDGNVFIFQARPFVEN